MASSRATSHSTSTGAIPIPPPVSGSGASRVQRTTPSGSGSPDATPRVNGSLSNLNGCDCVQAPSWPSAARAVSRAVAPRKARPSMVVALRGRARFVGPVLQLVEAVVDAPLREQGPMCSHLDHAALGQNDDGVHVLRGREPVGDDDR